MKKILFVVLIFALLAINVSAEENSWLKLQFNTVPESPTEGAGWVNLKDIVEVSDSVSVTIYNGGEDAFAAYISGRDKDWANVCATEQIYIESGESETLVLDDIDATVTRFMLEFRELYVGAVVYIRGAEKDYTAITTLSSDLSDHFTLTVADITEVTDIPEVEEPKPTEEPKATNTPTETPKATEVPSKTAEPTPITTAKTEKISESNKVYEPEDIYVTVTTLVIVSLISAFSGVIIGGILVFLVTRKYKKG